MPMLQAHLVPELAWRLSSDWKIVMKMRHITDEAADKQPEYTYRVLF